MHALHAPRTEDYGNVYDGEQVPSVDGRTFVSSNPTTGREWARFPVSTAVDVDRAVSSAHRAFVGPWAALTPTERGRRLARWGELITAAADEIGSLESVQNGKVVAEMRLQVSTARDWLGYYGGLADKIEGAVVPLTSPDVLNYTLREPLGVIAVILPWNSPTFMTMMAAAPALAAGNTVVIKPSEVTSASASVLARLALDADIPPGVVNVVTGLRETGEALIDHPHVKKVSFIGSVPAGRAIGAQAGGRLITSTLELGGKSPHIVFEDADVDLAESGLMAGIFAAAGQTCIAGSRAYVHTSLYDEVVDRLVKRAADIRIGDPLDDQTQMGPVSSAAQLAKDVAMVQGAVAEGAELLHGGDAIQVPGLAGGHFFAPTILHRAAPSSTIMREEVFGPVLTITPFGSDEEVLRLANDSEFGLAAGVWTNDVRRAHSMARALQAGTVWINTYRALAFNSPFGGYKNSGTGRNNGIEAIEQYLQTKSVWCDLGRDELDPFVIRV